MDPESSRMNMMFGAGYGVPDCSGTPGIFTSEVAAETGAPIRVARQTNAATPARFFQPEGDLICFMFLQAMVGSESGNAVDRLQQHHRAIRVGRAHGDAITAAGIGACGFQGDIATGGAVLRF